MPDRVDFALSKTSVLNCFKLSFCLLLSKQFKTPTLIVVHHPLRASAHHGGGGDCRQSLKQSEERKRAASEDLCHGCGWLFAPMGWHTWGGVGPYASALLARIENAFAGDCKAGRGGTRLRPSASASHGH